MSLLNKLSHSPVYRKLQRYPTARKIGSMLNTCVRFYGSVLKIIIEHPYILLWNTQKILPSITKKDVDQALNALATLKKSITGRVCGDVGDSLAQYLTIVQYVRQTGIKNIDSLEIGTLFGGGCLMKLFAIRNLGCSGIATCIDPMRGYITCYGEQEYDPHSKVPVNPETFYSNIKKFEFSEQDVKLITEMSDSPNAFKELKEKSYATLIIDGDHSYDGVKYDWEHYNKYVADGGFVLFDDYNEIAWPDVTKFVDQIIESSPPEWKVCGTIGTTIILQRVPITEC